MTDELASEDEIRAYIERKHSELACCGISIGLLPGRTYNVVVTDTEDLLHTLHLTDEDLARSRNAMPPQRDTRR